MDITKEIIQWQEDGEHIIIMADFNDDVTISAMCQWAAHLGLIKAITYLHPDNPPPTFQCGTQPIDRIFGTLATDQGGGEIS